MVSENIITFVKVLNRAEKNYHWMAFPSHALDQAWRVILVSRRTVI